MPLEFWDKLFNTTCIIAAAGWISILFLSPFWLKYDKFIVGIVITILAITYCYCNITNPVSNILSKFKSLNGIGDLFAIEGLRLAAWVHIMAFDLLGAVWIKKNSIALRIKHWVIIPALIFTCLLGPFGLLIYVVTRWIKTKEYLANNGS